MDLNLKDLNSFSVCCKRFNQLFNELQKLDKFRALHYLPLNEPSLSNFFNLKAQIDSKKCLKLTWSFFQEESDSKDYQVFSTPFSRYFIIRVTDSYHSLSIFYQFLPQDMESVSSLNELPGFIIPETRSCFVYKDKLLILSKCNQKVIIYDFNKPIKESKPLKILFDKKIQKILFLHSQNLPLCDPEILIEFQHFCSDDANHQYRKFFFTGTYTQLLSNTMELYEINTVMYNTSKLTFYLDEHENYLINVVHLHPNISYYLVNIDRKTKNLISFIRDRHFRSDTKQTLIYPYLLKKSISFSITGPIFRVVNLVEDSLNLFTYNNVDWFDGLPFLNQRLNFFTKGGYVFAVSEKSVSKMKLKDFVASIPNLDFIKFVKDHGSISDFDNSDFIEYDLLRNLHDFSFIGEHSEKYLVCYSSNARLMLGIKCTESGQEYEFCFEYFE
jgi:hypothetical protein